MGAQSKQDAWLAAYLEAREAERSRLARLLHDEVGQILSAVGLQLDLLRMDCANRPELAQRVGDAQKLLERAVSQVRELSYWLNPAIVERAGLRTALEKLIQRYAGSFQGELRLRWDPEAQLPLPAAQACYKLAEQALQDGLRCADGGAIEVRVERTEEGVRLMLRAEGPVAQAWAASEAPGWQIMQYHARQGGLRLTLAGGMEKSTIVEAVFPRREQAAAAAGGRRRRSPGG